ncbi:chromosome transmission fidelity protein 8 homolog [Cimex lectularius]|uniref:Chromosome transmission fidelity protein 8 homolog n=1 Tax=Cimex lectularius TaxID=79782 RepID=A0A8I6RH23_CIMLE|nr:chromosome transmission fidelity protein 8 homolog [Cimex lectularius]
MGELAYPRKLSCRFFYCLTLDEENVDSWGIIELQGELESRINKSMLDQFVGDLHFSVQNNAVPVLIIGHHILYGRCVNMEKPYAVLEKRRANDSTEYTVKAVVKKKIVFKIRPKPIIANVTNQ